MDLDDDVSGGSAIWLTSMWPIGSRFRSTENRKLDHSIERIARAAAEAPRFGLWSGRADEMGPLSGPSDPKVPCFVHIHGGYWQRGSKEIFACLAEGVPKWLASAALPGYTLTPEASLTQITNELRSAFDWLDVKGAEHGIAGPTTLSRGWSAAAGHLTAFLFGSSKSGGWVVDLEGLAELAPLRDSPQVNDKGQIDRSRSRETLSSIRRLSVNKPLSIAYGTGELPAMIATSRDYHAYRSESHLPGDLIPIAKANHFTILDELRLRPRQRPSLTRQILQLATYKVT